MKLQDQITSFQLIFYILVIIACVVIYKISRFICDDRDQRLIQHHYDYMEIEQNLAYERR